MSTLAVQHASRRQDGDRHGVIDSRGDGETGNSKVRPSEKLKKRKTRKRNFTFPTGLPDVPAMEPGAWSQAAGRGPPLPRTGPGVRPGSWAIFNLGCERVAAPSVPTPGDTLGTGST